jgi:hypothetical protein|tara:strand:- start:943 stop:1467 length:525 start_codon:yes stop_codon:yes gene_type:complete
MAILTDEQTRQLRDYIPSLSNRGSGIDLATIIDNVHDVAVLADQIADRATADIVTNATPITLTAGADAGNSMPVAVSSPIEAVQQYIARLYDEDMLLAVAAAWRLTETGTGAEIAGSGSGTLIFTTDALGDAIITITDVATGTNETLSLVVEPLPLSGGQYSAPGAFVVCDFDA